MKERNFKKFKNKFDKTICAILKYIARVKYEWKHILTWKY